MKISTRNSMHLESHGRAVPARRLLVLCCVCAVSLAGVACSGAEQNTATTAANEPSTPANEPAAANPVDGAAQEVTTGFLEAYGAFDTDQAITYLADDADVSGLVSSVGEPFPPGALEQFPLLVSQLEAEGYKQMLHSCEEVGTSASGTKVPCTFDFHLLGSDEIGRGPYSGSSFELAVRDGEIVQASVTWEIAEFSPQMWEPFYSWTHTTYPKDAEIMYVVGGVRLTEESTRLWEQHRQDYVAHVVRTTTVAETSP
jgi:hypothetical protein